MTKKPDRPISFASTNQKKFYSAIKQNQVIFCVGLPGTGKSHVAMYAGAEAIHTKAITCLYLARPTVETGKGIGFLPGSAEEKMSVHTVVFDSFARMFGLQPKSFKIEPLEFMRGRTFDDWLILDEAQNCTIDQLRMVLTRLGKTGKLIILGDPEQSDIKGDCPLNPVIDKIKRLNGVAVIEMGVSDIVRHDLVGEIIQALR